MRGGNWIGIECGWCQTNYAVQAGAPVRTVWGRFVCGPKCEGLARNMFEVWAAHGGDILEPLREWLGFPPCSMRSERAWAETLALALADWGVW